MTRNLSDIGYETHLLEYYPGTYGDFVSGLITYSIEEFVDTYELDNKRDRYWTYAGEASLLRNRYELSLRGNGYEFVETFSEHLLAHNLWIMYPKLVWHPQPNTKILFNCHPSIIDKKFRTTTNSFTNTKTKFLLLEDNFDIMLKSTINEYYSSIDDKSDLNKDVFFERFRDRLIVLRNAKNNISDDNILYVRDIDDISPEHISSYGNVNEELFYEYKNEYVSKKLNKLNHIFNEQQQIVKSKKDLYKKLLDVYKNVK